MLGGRLFLAAFVAAASGCGLWEEPHTGADPSDPVDPADPTPGGTAGDEEARSHPLRLAPVPPVVPWDVLPVAGSGPPGGRVAIWGTGDAAIPVDIDARGHFCVDVPLAAGRPQRLRAELLDARIPEETTLEVSRAVLPMLGLDPGANAAPQGALGTSMGSDAPLARLLDGKRATGVELTSAWLDDDWLWLALPSPVVTDQIVIGADPECPLAQFVLHTSDRAVPGDPRTDADTWRHQAIETSWPVTEIGLPPTPVRHVAISVEGPGCRLSAADEGRHRLVELQVWVAEAAPLVMAPPRCDR